MKRFRQYALVGLIFWLIACGATSSTTPMLASTDVPTSTPQPGDLIKGTSSTVYRRMEDGTLRHIRDWATFLAWGFSPASIRTYPQTVINQYVLGAPLTRFVTGQSDTNLYALFNRQRYRLDPAQSPFLRLIDTFPRQVARLPDALVQSLPLATSPYPAPIQFPDDPPHITGAAWFQGVLWLADDSGALRQFNLAKNLWATVNWQPVQGEYISVLFAAAGRLIAGTSAGRVLRVDVPGSAPLMSGRSWISALGIMPAAGAQGEQIVAADRDAYSLERSIYREGSGVISASGGLRLASSGLLQRINALVADEKWLWGASDYTGLVRCERSSGACTAMNTVTSDSIVDNQIRDIKRAADDTLWIAYSGGVSRLQQDKSVYFGVGADVSAEGLQAILLTDTGAVWAAGDNFVARITPDGQVRNFTAMDYPLFLDTFRHVVKDAQGGVWFIGDTRLLHFDGTRWTAFTIPHNTSTESVVTPFDPEKPTVDLAPTPSFPDPRTQYAKWLSTWPRPALDNGRGLHYVQSPSGDAFESRQQIARLQALKVRWTVVNYIGHGQLVQLAPLFARAGIMVIWRPYVSPLVKYDFWADDVRFLRSLGIPPYIQIYNEPNLEQAGSNIASPQETYHQNLIGAVKAVYEAGGYVGLQHIDVEWLRASLRALKAAGLASTFDRLFFIPHPYGLNHPPAYDADLYGALGFRVFAQVFREEVGFVPMMIAGEGGWRPFEAQDNRYPAVSLELHRDYLLAVMGWFQTGVLSNGEPLPDYLFAFCPWLLSDTNDPAGWFDNRATGDRTLVIDAVKALPDFVRTFQTFR